MGEELFEVHLDDVQAFVLRFDLWSLLTSTYYVQLWPGPGFDTIVPAEWRALKKQFTSLTGKTFFCQCEITNTTAERFARFFGFKTVGKIENRWHMEKN